MSAGDLAGWVAAALTLLAFLMRSMTALRLAAIAANLCFILYGMLNVAWPVLALHLVLLPCNLQRLWELQRSAGGDSGDDVSGRRDHSAGGATRRIFRLVKSCQAR
ncbi:MAG: hypothetical protein ACM35H_02055 [Bacteroidota bacterium]|nr:hypothetical protein [Kiloniellaceae bacterium]